MNGRRLSVVLCLAILAGATWIVHELSFGFEVWTFEGRRQRLIATGSLRAPQVPLRFAREPAQPLWRDDSPGRHGASPNRTAYLVDFVYTRCPGVCRALGNEYQQMQRALASDPPEGDIRLVSISFDVAYDDPSRLAAQAALLRADPQRWSFAVPGTARDAEALLGGLGVIAIPDGMGGFVHNGDIHLLDGQGRLRAVFAFDRWPEALEAARQLTAPRPATDVARQDRP